MKGKKLIFAFVLTLIVCLMLVPVSAYADTSDETVPDVTVSEEPKQEELKQEEPKQEEPKQEEPKQEEPKQEEPTKEEPTKEEPTKEEPKQEELKQEEPKLEEPKLEEPPAETSTPLEKTGYQVEFTFNDKTVVKDGLKGGEQFDLNEILTELGFTTCATQAKGNADDLFSVVQGENGLVVVSHMAFNTEHEIVATIDGVDYVIKVKDDNAPKLVDNKTDLKTAVDSPEFSGQTVLVTDDIDVGYSSGSASDVNNDRLVFNSGETVYIDLGGKTIYNSKKDSNIYTLKFQGGGNYMLINGTVIGKISVENAKLTLASNVKVEGLVLVCTGGQLDVNGEIENTGNSALQTHGSSTGGVINIYDGAKVTSTDDVAVYLPSGSMTVHGGTITGTSGVYIKAGTLTVNGGTIIANGQKQSFNTRGDGCDSTGDAIVVEYSADGYGTIDNVYLNNGTVTSANGNALGVYEGNRADKQDKGDKATVDGGVYSDDSVEDYIPKEGVIIGTSGDKYLVGDDVVNALLDGETVELTNYPEAFDNVTLPVEFPVGATVINKTGRDIILLGVPLKNGESMSVVAPAATTGDVLYAKYYVVDGKAQTWTKGSADGLKFELNSDKVVKVLIDGVEVEFTVENGEIVIAAEVLEALEAGEHEIEFVFADGSCKTEFTVK